MTIAAEMGKSDEADARLAGHQAHSSYATMAQTRECSGQQDFVKRMLDDLQTTCEAWLTKSRSLSKDG